MTPFYVLLYVAYPYENGARFYIPLLPVFAASLLRLISTLPSRRHLVVASMLCAHFALAAGYAWTADAARGRAAQARWPDIEAVAEAVASRPERGIAWQASGDDVFMLELILDRPVPVASPGSIPPETEWIVAGPGAPAVPQFRLFARTDSLRVLRRRDSQNERYASTSAGMTGLAARKTGQ